MIKKLLHNRDLYVFCALFLVAAFIRLWPEIRVGYWPIGYDTLNTYVPDLIKFDGDFWRWLSSANLLYFLYWPIYKIFSVDPNYVVKIGASLIYGLFAGSFYLFLRRFFKWEWFYATLAVILIIIQIPTLRMSWDLTRNVLGLVFLFPALYALQTNSKAKNLFYVGLFSALVVLSHQLVAAIWFIVLAVYLIAKLIKKDFGAFWKVLAVSLPAMALFANVLISPSANTFSGRVMYESDSSRLLNYFDVYKKRMPLDSLQHVIFSLFWMYFKYLLPLALVGFYFLRKNLLLTTVTVWLLLASFSSLVFGGYGIFVWDRWMLMLAIPFTVYAVEAIRQLQIYLTSKRWPHANWYLPVLITFYVLIQAWVVFPYINSDYDDAKKPYLDKEINAYMPPTLVHNAVGFEHLKHVVSCILYIDRKAPENSVILIDNRYRGLVLLWFDHTKRFVYSYPWSKEINDTAIAKYRDEALGPIFTIWSSQENIEGFEKVHYSSTTAVYRDKESYDQYLINTGQSDKVEP